MSRAALASRVPCRRCAARLLPHEVRALSLPGCRPEGPVCQDCHDAARAAAGLPVVHVDTLGAG